MQGDTQLVQIVDAAMAEAVRKSGPWLACRPGCFQCCIGPFPITELDAARLRDGLTHVNPATAARVRQRAMHSVERLERDYPGDTPARVLAEDGAGENDLCPALDPETGTCELYAWRPITCRTFGPAVSFGGDALAICELCYTGASDEQIAACRQDIDAADLESRLLAALGNPGDTIVAFALTHTEARR